MTRRRPTNSRAAWVAAVVLPVLTPGALALAGGDEAPASTPPASTPPVIVAEHTGTARHVVPFGIASGDEGQRTIWAFGRTRPASTLRGTTPVAPSPTTPGSAVLLQGTIANASAPTAWQRASPPLDVAGLPLTAGTWRPADGTTAPAVGTTPDAESVMHSGAATPKGAAALLVRITPGGGTPARTAILARTTDGRFRELPAPPAELVAPAADPYAGADDQLTPFAVADAPTTPSDQADRGRTAVFLAPTGSDGVLRWDGTRWSEEPWVDAAGAPSGARTPLALAATPTGDAVALFAGDATAATGARVRIARRNATTQRFVPVTITGGSALLQGDLPEGVKAIAPAPRPGTALTIAPRHWWIDLLVSRADGRREAATVHLRPPGVREPGTTPDPTSPAATTSTPDASTPTTTTSPAPATSTPQATTPTTPDATSPDATTPTTPTDAEATGTWCSPGVSKVQACDRELGFEFAPARGWTSAAFDGTGRYGERAISSPVIPEDVSPTSTREASASGGYLQLSGTSFTLRSGAGDDGTNDSQAARFAAGGFAVTGGVQGVARTMPRTAAAAATLRQANLGTPDGLIDISVAPPGTPPSERGALSFGSSMGVMRQRADRDWSYVDYGVGAPIQEQKNGPRLRGSVNAIAWPAPNLVIYAGGKGLLQEAELPSTFSPFESSPAPNNKKYREVEVDGDDLLDVAGAGESALAVGRDGAAWRRSSGGVGDADWFRVELDGDLGVPDLTSVAYAGTTPIVASSNGVLTLDPSGATLVLDEELARLMREDQRPVAAQVVAGLPDGTAVVDGRYVRTGAGAPWQRLAWPLEGDVVALSLWREGSDGPQETSTTTPATDPAQTTSTTPTSPVAAGDLGTLRIAASVGDRRRPVYGEIREERDGPKETDTYLLELPPKVTDGRLLVLGPRGWIDRVRTPLARSSAHDLAARTPPVAAIATDANGDGWVAGGTGTIDDVFRDRAGDVPEQILGVLGTPPYDVRAADERPIEGVAARQQLADPVPTAVATTPAPTSDASPAPTAPTTPDTIDVPLPAPAGPSSVRVLVGGHPACLSDCAGRGDQGLAPDSTLEDALVTAEKVSAPGQGGAPSVLVLGGGRAAVGSRGLSRAGAARYLELLRMHPTVPTVLAIGTGDAVTDASRANFAEAARTLLRERTAPGSPLTLPTTPSVAPIERDGSTTVAYALDATGADGTRARIVVIDNAGGRLNGSADGPQARWLFQTLEEAERNGWQTVVVGAARLDGVAGTQATDREDELAILGRGGADVYISTDGVDDPTSRFFGDQSVRYPTDRTHGNPIAMYRTSALGHQRRSGLFGGFYEESRDEPDALRGWLAPAILDVGLGGGTPVPDVALLPVLTSILAQDAYAEVGGADATLFLGLTRATTGMRVPKPSEEEQPGPPVIDKDGNVVDLPATTPPATTPTPTTQPSPESPELVDTRAPGWMYASPLPCRIYGAAEECRGQVPIDATYDVVDPSIAVFVRASPRKGEAPPQIATDERGDPVIDRRSSVLCPLRPGKTSIVLRVAGRTATFPLTVFPPGGRRPKQPKQTAACAFRWGGPPTAEEKPTPTTPEAPAPPVIAEPGPQPQPAPLPEPRTPVIVPRPFSPIVAATAPFTPYRAFGQAAPPVAPNPKPASPGAPPAPPSGVSTQQVPVQQAATQVQTFAVTAEERRAEVAREGADYQASRLSHESAPAEARRQAQARTGAAGSGQARTGGATDASRAPEIDTSPTYRSSDSGPALPLLAGGLLAALTALAGHTAGRRRRAKARRRSWLR